MYEINFRSTLESYVTRLANHLNVSVDAATQILCAYTIFGRAFNESKMEHIKHSVGDMVSVGLIDMDTVSGMTA